MNYKCIRRCYGFRNRMWEEGNVAENVTPEEKIPYHFEKISSNVPVTEPVVVNDPMKPVEILPGQKLKVKGGFGPSVPGKEEIPVKMVNPVKKEPEPVKKKRKSKKS